MRILQTIRQGEFGGGETHLYELSTRLNTKEFTPIVLSFSDGNMVEKLRERGVEVIVIPSTIPFDPRLVSKVRDVIEDQEIDVIHAHGTRAYSNVIIPALRLKKPIIYTIHGWSFNDTQKSVVRNLRIKVESFLTRKSNTNICVSLNNEKTGKEQIKGFDCNVIYNGVSFDTFNPQIEVSKERLIRKSEEQFIIGFIARMSFQKDPITLLKAFKQLHQKHPHVQLLMIGSGELDNHVEEYSTINGLENAIIRLPFTPHVNEYLKQVDIFCLPSLWEGLPIGAIEAMAMEKVVVATSVDGTKELIEHDKNGYLFQPRHVEELVEVFDQLITDTALMKKIATNALEHVKTYFSIDLMVDKTTKIYESISSSISKN